MSNVLMVELAAVVADTASRLGLAMQGAGTRVVFAPEQFHACIGEALQRLSDVEVAPGDVPAPTPEPVREERRPSPVSEGGWGLPSPTNTTTTSSPEVVSVVNNPEYERLRLPTSTSVEFVSGVNQIAPSSSRSDCTQEAFGMVNKALDLLALVLAEKRRL